MEKACKALREVLYALNRAKSEIDGYVDFTDQYHELVRIRDEVVEVLKVVDPTWKD